MNIHQIAEKLNTLAKTEKFEIAKLPDLRKKYLGKKRLPFKIFTSHTIFDTKDIYAFHHGGRDEIQFNFGSEYLDDGEMYTRYAICFSLEPSHSLPNPMHDLQPFRLKFNQCIEMHPEYFEGVEMWYYQNNQRIGNFPPQIIPDEWFQLNTFIAVGNLIKKPIDHLDESDLLKILNGFDNLLPIYQFCVLQKTPVQSVENRIAKVCWNENDWTYPSGKYGKSKQQNSHENERGYGHEEWLFDFEKLINGYHYALLQPVQKGRVTFLNNFFNVRLFSRNSDTKEYLWIGSIKNLEVISNEDAEKVYKEYKEKGWLNEMAQHIKSVNGDVAHFRSLKPHECFNVRFKPEYAVLNSLFKKVEDFKNQIGTYHYQFVRDKSPLPTKERVKPKRREFNFTPGKFEKSLTNRISNRQKKAVQSEPVHDKIQKILYKHLLKIYGEDKVGVETDTGLTTRIDVSVSSNEGIILYEVKSYPSVMISIRIALGQLLEYAYYPNPIKNLKEMIIVSHIPIDSESQEYFEFLRETASLKVYYQSVDIDNEQVSKKA
jgi:hypothetical protein